jgi:nucleoside-diphosphate-sugar epimerase
MRRGTIVVLGADGYLGWPTSLHLSAQGHDVVAVDSLVRRPVDRDLLEQPDVDWRMGGTVLWERRARALRDRRAAPPADLAASGRVHG